jgi:hypothetical protein
MQPMAWEKGITLRRGKRGVKGDPIQWNAEWCVMLFDSVPGHHILNNLVAAKNIRFQSREQ